MQFPTVSPAPDRSRDARTATPQEACQRCDQLHAATVTIDTVAGTDDVDALWSSFVAARDSGDDRLADALRDRMVEVQQDRRLGRLTTDQLLDRIDVLQRRMLARGTARDATACSAVDHVVDITDEATERRDLDDLLRELERRSD